LRIVVTGGAGFIGSHVADALIEEGHAVTVIDDLSTGHVANLAGALRHHAELVEADITSPHAQRVVAAVRPEVVMLLAAQPSVKVSMRDPILDAHVNVSGLLSMLSTAAEAGSRKIIFATSGGTIYGDVNPVDLPVLESHGGQPNSFYGLTKKLGVDYLRLYYERHGLETVSLALGNVYGDRQDPLGEAGVVAIFLDRLRWRRPCVINGSGETTRDFVHVDDVADAFVRAIGRGAGLINIGTGRETSVATVYETLAGHFPEAGPPVHGPELDGEVARVSLDWSRARTRLGWAPTIDFEKGVARDPTNAREHPGEDASIPGQFGAGLGLAPAPARGHLPTVRRCLRGCLLLLRHPSAWCCGTAWPGE